MLTKSEIQDLKTRAQFAHNHGYELAHAKGYVLRLNKALGAPLNQSVCPNTPEHVLALIAQLEEADKDPVKVPVEDLSVLEHVYELSQDPTQGEKVNQEAEVILENLGFEAPAEVAPVVAQEEVVAVSEPVVEEDAPVVEETKEEVVEASEPVSEEVSPPETVKEEAVVETPSVETSVEEKPTQGKGKKGKRSN